MGREVACLLCSSCFLMVVGVVTAAAQMRRDVGGPAAVEAETSEIEVLRAEVAAQRQEILDLRKALEEQKELLERILASRLVAAAAASVSATKTAAGPSLPAAIPLTGATAAEKPPAAQEPATDELRFKLTPYGRVELDVTYSSRGTNSLDPRQFNGYATAAGPQGVASSTLNPRFTLMGLAGDVSRGDQKLQTKVEFDFYSTDAANLITPRLRLAYVQYSRKQTSATVGMDWLPVASLLPDILDFSIMGYGGNLWQRLPQITIRQQIGKRWEVLGTLMRFERGFTLQPQPYVSDPFTDPVRMPYIGTRLAYQNWGAQASGLFAASGAYRRFEHPLTRRKVHSHLIAAEAVVPIAQGLKWSSKLAHGQGLGDEFFRFGQALNRDGAIRVTVGWTQLSYALNRWSFAGGWGLDDPRNKDLRGISNNNLNYSNNKRVFANTVYSAFAHVKIGFEYNFLRTRWTNNDLFSAHQSMLAIFYSF